MISSAHRTASATALRVAGTLFPHSNCANFLAARILAAISSMRRQINLTGQRLSYSPGEDQAGRRLFLVPRTVADARAKQDKPTSKTKTERYWRQDKVAEVLSEFEDNFCLSLTGKQPPPSFHPEAQRSAV